MILMTLKNKILKSKNIPFHFFNNDSGRGILCLDLRGTVEGSTNSSLG